MSTILVVDDEKNVLKTLSIGLERYDYKVEKAQNGAEALKLFTKNRYDLLVTDIRMSPVDGYTLAAEINQKYPETRIILMSAYGFDEEGIIKRDLTYPTITKPFSVEELVEKIQGEEKKITKSDYQRKKILILGNPKHNQQIQEELVEWGFQTKILDPDQQLQNIIHNTHYDLFLIDEELLKTESWKILNLIDQMAPEKPVIILNQVHGSNHHYSQKELKTSIIDRESLMKNPTWSSQFLIEHLEKVT